MRESGRQYKDGIKEPEAHDALRSEIASDRFGDSISNPWLGNDDPRIAGILFDFLPKLTDIDAEILGIRQRGTAPI